MCTPFVERSKLYLQYIKIKIQNTKKVSGTDHIQVIINVSNHEKKSTKLLFVI